MGIKGYCWFYEANLMMNVGESDEQKTSNHSHNVNHHPFFIPLITNTGHFDLYFSF